MSKVDQMIESVLSGTDPQSVISESDTPNWKPGDKVPVGYHVVFGHLVKKGPGSQGPQLGRDKASAMAHHASTIAHKSDHSDKAKGRSPSTSVHADAAGLHMKAAAMHKNDGNHELAAKHRDAAIAHQKSNMASRRPGQASDSNDHETAAKHVDSTIEKWRREPWLHK